MPVDVPPSAAPALITSHLFVIAPNNSGSTLLRRAIGRSAGALTLPREGQHVPGYHGPSSRSSGMRLLWACNPERAALFTDDSRYDWDRTRRAWHFHAVACSPQATVLVVSSPPFLLRVDALARTFEGARFLFVTRDPYAILEGICRRPEPGLPVGQDDCRVAAAHHIVACFEAQARNIAGHKRYGAALTYEELCASPHAIEARIAALVPGLGAVDLTTPVAVKGRPPAPLEDMNAEQIARLAREDFAAANRVFDAHWGLFESFGYQRRTA